MYIIRAGISDRILLIFDMLQGFEPWIPLEVAHFLKQKNDTTIAVSFCAEKQGFEPWIPFDRYTHFPGVPLQPLEHLSFEGMQM
jgi:hypothetical protein